jgi:hypothetical protein
MTSIITSTSTSPPPPPPPTAQSMAFTCKPIN